MLHWQPYPLTAGILAATGYLLLAGGLLVVVMRLVGAEGEVPSMALAYAYLLVTTVFAASCGYVKATAARRNAAVDDAEGILDIDRNRYIRSANEAIARMLGYSATELHARPIAELLASTDSPWFRAFENRLGYGTPTCSLALRRKDSSWRWVELSDRTVARNQSHRSLSLREIPGATAACNQRLMHNILSTVSDSVVMLDAQWRVTWVNASFERITRYRAEEVVGSSPPFATTLDQSPSLADEIKRKLAVDGVWRGRIQTRRRDGEDYPIMGTIRRLVDVGGDSRYLCCFTDVSALHAYEEQVRELAVSDTLTRLPNRSYFARELEQRLGHLNPQADRCAVLMLNLDHFRRVNESFSHDTGDAVLVQVAQRLRATLPEAALLARHSGDSFLVLLQPPLHASDAALTAQRLNESIAVPYRVDGKRISVTASIGVSLYPTCGGTADDLLRGAEAAVGDARRHAPNSFRFYTEALGREARRFVEVTADLRQALNTGQLRNFYQPIVRCSDHRLVGLEALVRWRHPDRIVGPGDFLPIAEEAGLMDAIADTVLDTACRDLKQWFTDGFPETTVAINFSARQFADPELAERTLGYLRRSGVAPSRLRAEITESTLMQNGSVARTTIARLREAGVRVFIDDFGTGYSSLAYLRDLQVDGLKLDRSFVQGLPDNGADETITRSVVAIARALSLVTIAEGVETAAQATRLRELGCDFLQGYYFHRPAPPGTIHAHYRNDTASDVRR